MDRKYRATLIAPGLVLLGMSIDAHSESLEEAAQNYGVLQQEVGNVATVYYPNGTSFNSQDGSFKNAVVGFNDSDTLIDCGTHPAACMEALDDAADSLEGGNNSSGSTDGGNNNNGNTGGSNNSGNTGGDNNNGNTGGSTSTGSTSGGSNSNQQSTQSASQSSSTAGGVSLTRNPRKTRMPRSYDLKSILRFPGRKRVERIRTDRFLQKYGKKLPMRIKQLYERNMRKTR